jgi:hypothetical protein
MHESSVVQMRHERRVISPATLNAEFTAVLVG